MTFKGATTRVDSNMRKKHWKLFFLLVLFILLLTFYNNAKSILSSGFLLSFKSTKSSSAALLNMRPTVSISETQKQFCQNLIRNPQPCVFGVNGTCRSENQGDVMFSQNFQDYYLYTRHFQYSRRPGIYFDIATNHPIFISNTFFFDRCLNWGGVCVEANDQYFEPIFLERTCHLVPTCISNRDDQTVQFNARGVFGGIMEESYKYLRSPQMKKSPPRLLRCTTVKELCRRFGIQVIDYLSLDVEGHEFRVLEGVDWDNTRISIITVEINGPGFKTLSSYLRDKGYKRHQVRPTASEMSRYGKFLVSDAIFLHENLTFGSGI